MASVFGHAIAAIGIGKLFPKAEMTRKVYVLGAVSAMIPDVDVIGFQFDIQWESMWSHRGIYTFHLFCNNLGIDFTGRFSSKRTIQKEISIG